MGNQFTPVEERFFQKPFRSGVIPSHWIRRGGLRDFRRNQPQSLASLKLYLALAYWNAIERAEMGASFEHPFCTPYKYKLAVTAGFLDADFYKPIRFLENLNLIKTNPEGKQIRFEILGDRSLGWAALPLAPLKEGILGEMPVVDLKSKSTKKRCALEALKIYLYLLAIRKVASNTALTTYDWIESGCGIQRKEIRYALSLLMELKLIHLEHTFKRAIDGSITKGPNSYFILALREFHPRLEKMLIDDKLNIEWV